MKLYSPIIIYYYFLYQTIFLRTSITRENILGKDYEISHLRGQQSQHLFVPFFSVSKDPKTSQFYHLSFILVFSFVSCITVFFSSSAITKLTLRDITTGLMMMRGQSIGLNQRGQSLILTVWRWVKLSTTKQFVSSVCQDIHRAAILVLLTFWAWYCLEIVGCIVLHRILEASLEPPPYSMSTTPFKLWQSKAYL